MVSQQAACPPPYLFVDISKSSDLSIGVNNKNHAVLFTMTTKLMRMFGLEDVEDEYDGQSEPSVVRAMRKVTGRWDEEDQKCAETKMPTNEVRSKC